MRAPAWLLLLRRSCRRGYRRQLLDTLEAVGVEQDRMAHLDDIEAGLLVATATSQAQVDLLVMTIRAVNAETRAVEAETDLRVLLDGGPAAWAEDARRG